MQLGAFLKDRWLYIAVRAAVAGFVLLMLSVLGLNPYAQGFIFGVLLLGECSCLVAEFSKKRSFYNDMCKRLENLDRKYLLCEMLEKPNFIEGELLYDTLQTVDKAMNDRIAEYNRASADYREYIETWVHEIKTPIASSRLIIENNQSQVTRNINEELYKIEGFVEQALYYTRSNSVEKDYIIKKVNLKEMVNTAVKKNARALIESKVTIELCDLDCEVFTDVKWTDFILCQILDNSIKYRKQNAVIHIDARQNDNDITVCVRDNGIGIPRQDVRRVFEKGFTGENGRKYTRSTGIGLYLCKKLCDKMGLKIELESKEGVGTQVYIVFPRSKMFLLESHGTSAQRT